tara:strand:+ start:145 stop:681 length:537 start_codon:yes stop_codon:yes gene_type:complete
MSSHSPEDVKLNASTEYANAEMAVYEGPFKIANYIPYRLAQAQLVVHRAVSPDTNPELQAIAQFTQRDIRVLGMIGQHASISPSMVAERTGLDRATVTRALALLSEKKMIVRMQNAQDGRGKYVSLSKLGAKYCNILFPIMQDYGAYLEEALSPDEKEQLLLLLEKVRLHADAKIKNN